MKRKRRRGPKPSVTPAQVLAQIRKATDWGLSAKDLAWYYRVSPCTIYKKVRALRNAGEPVITKRNGRVPVYVLAAYASIDDMIRASRFNCGVMRGAAVINEVSAQALGADGLTETQRLRLSGEVLKLRWQLNAVTERLIRQEAMLAGVTLPALSA